MALEQEASRVRPRRGFRGEGGEGGPWKPPSKGRGQQGPQRPARATRPCPDVGSVHASRELCFGSGQSQHGKAGVYRKATSYRKSLTTPSVSGSVEQCELLYTACRSVNSYDQFRNKLRHCLVKFRCTNLTTQHSDSYVLHLETLTCAHLEIKRILMATTLCPSRGEWNDDLWFAHTMECLMAVKTNALQLS